jgi:crossover junction endodeoxyribonuclease RuvC
MGRPIRILGIDPGLRRTGWGVIEVEGNRLVYVACGSAQSDETAALAMRLVTLHDALVRVVDAFRPDEAAIEQTFVNKNAAATLKLGQARGIALMVPARAGVLIAEYAPNLIKKTIVGAGHGDKAQIRMMLGVLMPKADPQTHDAADALAIAITHAHHRHSAVRRAAIPSSASAASGGAGRGQFEHTASLQEPPPQPSPASGGGSKTRGGGSKRSRSRIEAIIRGPVPR